MWLRSYAREALCFDAMGANTRHAEPLDPTAEPFSPGSDDDHELCENCHGDLGDSKGRLVYGAIWCDSCADNNDDPEVANDW